ncbi:MAG TPA: sulfatase-like hydrolase/transferase [Polyangiaceae bacterium]|nr:sulfatase-like hydrolase/transferase [Polyangiaceae bacterium]
MRNRRLLTLALALGVLASCRDDSKPKQVPLPKAALPALRDDSPRRAKDLVTELDWIDNLARCEVSHAGVLVDLGSPGAQGISGNWSFASDAGEGTDRGGETWAKISTRALSVRFVLEQPEAVFVSMRVRGGLSRSAAVSLDGKPLGAVPLIRGQARVVATRATPAPLPAGSHTIELRFAGASRSATEPLAEIDWIRAGTAADDARTYAPPTMNQMVANVQLAQVAHRSIALRAPSTLRCSTFVPAGARLKLALGFEGQGEGEGEVSVLRDGEAPVVLHAAHVKGGEHGVWTPVDLSLDAFNGKLVTLEFRSKAANPGGRVLFGDPKLDVASPPVPPPPPARLVMVVVLSGLHRGKLANHEMFPTLADLGRSATTFESHRSPTTVVGGVVASILTGMSPRAHGVEDPGARLPGAFTTLGVAARDGSVQTAMFSGCPTTFEAFGFARGWDKYVAYSPVEGAPAVAPLTESAAWAVKHMEPKEARALVIVHARGGHPPWDVTTNEATKLPPSEYAGAMEPRRSGEIIARARGKHSRMRLSENDRTRMWAIYDAALAGQDRALGQLIEGLKKGNLWDKTLLVVTGDVSTNPESRAPFGDGEELTEEVLKVPLWVHFPGGALAGTKVALPTAMTDVSRTVLDALALPTPEGFDGLDLFAVASGASAPSGRWLVATLGPRYSVRLGDFALAGSVGKTPSLCEMVSDPSCDIDRIEKAPRAAALLFRLLYDVESAAQKVRRPREPATVDPQTAAALQVWGE